MAAKNQKSNNVIRSIPSLPTRLPGPDGKPANARLGATTGGPQYYGSGRGPVVAGRYTDAQLMQWRAGSGTSQQRYTTTRLPGEA